jgi:hypothetical protein
MEFGEDLNIILKETCSKFKEKTFEQFQLDWNFIQAFI